MLFVMLHSFLVLVFFAFVFALLNDMIMLEHIIANGRTIIEICERKWLCSNMRYVLVF